MHLPGKSTIHIDHSHPNVHLKWNNAIPPVVTVDSGTELSFDMLDGGHNQLDPDSTVADVTKFNFALGDPAHGPVYVNGAQPGDVLRVDFLSLQPASYGWTAIFPNFGLLADDFPDPALKLWDLNAHKDYAYFNERIRIPKRPFLGVAGLAHAESGEFSTIPPYVTGGNIDTKYITQGSSLYLPVEVEGALFSCGDGHAAQGDGEVCGTAIETPMKCTLRLTVEKNKPWVKSPHYQTSSEPRDPEGLVNKGEYAAVGINADVLQATRQALRSMIDWLVATKGLSKVDAYMLTSVAADLKMTEVVDMPHYAIACSIPLNIFLE